MELPVFIASLSLVVSVISSFYGFTQNKKLQEFEHRTREDTKEDLVKLDTALRSIVAKASYRTEMRNLDFLLEKKSISDFLLSPTWLAVQYLLSTHEDSTPLQEELLLILNRQEGITMGFAAHNAEKELTRISEQYHDELLDLKAHIYTMLPEISRESMERLSETAYNAVKSEISYNDTYFHDALKFLKEKKGVQDPTIDVYLAVLENNAELLKSAINAGGDLSLDDKALLKKYQKLLHDHRYVVPVSA